MTAKECILGRRSIRKFTGETVSHEVLENIIETASYAPSWKHGQIARYIVVEGEMKNKLSKLTSKYPGNGAIMENASAVVAVTIIKGRSGYERDGSFSSEHGDGWEFFDAGIATQTFALAAHEQGVGTVIQGIFDQKEASDLLEIPEDRKLIALVSLGYPAETPVAPKRKPVSELVSYK